MDFPRDTRNLLRSTLKPSSDSLRTSNPTTPRTSMSQLKLNQLLHNKPNYELENFETFELRDGFFDPIYTKPRNIIGSGNDGEDNNTTDNSNNKKKMKEPKGWWTYIELLPHIQQTKWEDVLKFCVAYLIALILCLVRPVHHWLGSYSTWILVSTIIHHPVHTVGAQLEMTLQSILGLAIGLGWSALARYLSVVTQPTRNHPGGVLFGGLFLGLLMMNWMKAKIPRFYYIFLSSGLSLIFLTVDVNLYATNVEWRSYFEISVPYAFGICIGLAVSVLVFPDFGYEKLVSSLQTTIGGVKHMLEELYITNEERVEDILGLQKQMVVYMMNLSSDYRDFSNEYKLSFWRTDHLKQIRNCLNMIVTPLRVIPTPTNIYNTTSDNDYESPEKSGFNTSNGTSNNISGLMTPMPNPQPPLNMQHFTPGLNSQTIYVSIVTSHFKKPFFELIKSMIDLVSESETSLKSRSTKQESESHSTIYNNLQTNILQLDKSYKSFTKSRYFCKDLLNDEKIINVFLTIRYLRNAAVKLLELSNIISMTTSSSKLSLYAPDYPIFRALQRLSPNCLTDLGFDFEYNYYRMNDDVNDAFERIYNLNTSRWKHEQESPELERSGSKPQAIRAIDHNDFNTHSTNPWRYKLYLLSRMVTSFETLQSIKISIILVFICLPGWLFESGWFYQANGVWGCVLAYWLISPKEGYIHRDLSMRLFSAAIGGAIGYGCKEALDDSWNGKEYVVAIIGMVVCSMSALLCLNKWRSGSVMILTFSMVTFNEISTDEETSKYSWILIGCILVSVLISNISIFILPYYSNSEIYQAFASLLHFIGQSYQSVSERYLYRDESDDPTELTLELANIREVRMTQFKNCIENLLDNVGDQIPIGHRLKLESFKELIISCGILLEKIIEARMSGMFFKIWEGQDPKSVEKLLSFRRDSISTVIFNFFILSNGFMNKTQIPRYLPSAISARKKLYDMIAEVETERYEQEQKCNNKEGIMNQLQERLNEIESLRHTNSKKDLSKDFLKTHWTQIHGMAFARAFTKITEELENVIELSKEILGEEGLFD